MQRTYEEIKKRTYIDPLFDAGFKAFLSDEQALVSFLNGVFHLEGDSRITAVTVKNTEINVIFPQVKSFRQDSYRGTWAIRNEKGLTISDKVKYILYDLTQFDKTLDAVQNTEDRWLYLLKHAGEADDLPDFGDDVISKAIKRISVKNASETLIKEQARDMVFTEEELDHLAAMRVRARREGAEEERAKNDAVNAKKAEFLRSHNVPDDIISAMLSIK